MIRSRLSYLRLILRILTLLIPALSYFIAVKVRWVSLFFPGLSSGVAILKSGYCFC